MAGTGKTSLVQRLNAHLHAEKRPPYIINLDPAVSKLPYGPNIDIRDTVNYKEARRSILHAVSPFRAAARPSRCGHPTNTALRPTCWMCTGDEAV